jgi:hypothetical protein
MANTKITELTEDTTPTSDDLVVTVNDAGGTPTNKKVTAGNLITKAHSLTDGNVQVASGVLTTSADVNATNLVAGDISTNTIEITGSLTLGGDTVTDSVTLDASPVTTGQFTQTLQGADGTIALLSDIGAGGGGDMMKATYDPTNINDSAFDTDNHTSGTTNKVYTATEQTKLSGIEAGADVTDATNVAAAGAVMESDTTTAAMSFVVDEDDMVSDTATKVPTQQSVKAYVDAQITGSVSGDVVGPASSTDNALARYDSTTGKLIQNSNATLSDSGDLKLSANRYLQADNIEPSSNGSLNFVGKSGTSAYEQGSVVISGGLNAGTGEGGSIKLQAGQAMGGGANGAVKVGNTSGYYASLDVSALTADRTLKLRNSTVDLTGGSDGHVLTVQADGSISPEALPATSLTLDGLTDVTITTPSTDQILKYNGSAWVNGAASGGGGGQTTYDAIVAASGGTHTTLGAALTAASAGWRILVLDSTTETGNISRNLAGITIVGASKSVVVNMANYTFSLSGANNYVTNLQFSFTTGNFYSTGNYCTFDDLYLYYTAYDASLSTSFYLGGTASKFINNRLYNAATTGTAYRVFQSNSEYAIIENNVFDVPVRGTTTATAAIFLGTSKNTFANNKIQSWANANNAYCVYVAERGNVLTGNDISSLTGNYAIYVISQDNVVANNRIVGGIRGVILESSFSICTGNSIVTQSNSGNAVRVNGPMNRVTGNYLAGNGTTDFAIYVEGGDDNIIANNNISTSATGIQVNAATSDRTIITGNTIHASTTKIVDSGTATILKDNIGVPPTFEKQQMLMKNTSGVSLAAGDVVIWKSVAAGDEVTTTTTAGDDKVFGVATGTIANNAYGYIQTLGKVTTLKVNGTADIAVGDFLTTYTSAGIAAKAAAGDMCFAVALEAYTADDSSGVLDALLITPRLI